MSSTAPNDDTVAAFQLGPYRIEAPIGAGGMGTVHKALDTRLARVVALKIANAQYSERFQTEARVISALNHPNICTLFDVGANYLVMEFIDGSTLRAEIGKGKIAPKLAARYGSQIAAALAEAHAHDIIHRDLKPANIMLTRHGVKVLDFGLAKVLSRDGITETNAVLGTPAYMAPEQVQGKQATAQSDLFALGLILYEMLSGKLPVPGASLGQMSASGSMPAISPPVTDAGFSKLVMQLLETNPELRPQTAAEVAGTLASIADRLATPAAPARRRFLAPIAILLLVLLAGGGWLYFRTSQKQWVRETAIPEITRLATTQPLAAFQLLQRAQNIDPQNPELSKLQQASTGLTSVTSTPSGAAVEIQDYLKPGAWYSLGTTPLKNVRIPNGYFRWKVSKAGTGQFISAPETDSHMDFALTNQQGTSATDTVPAGSYGEMIDFIGWFDYKLPAFDVDRYEVTNAQYQQFVDQGGYRKPEYWKETIVDHGKPITWQQAMNLFRDPTGRPGPSTWEGGHYPSGQADYPVAGVSWYEAAAYAAYAGKSLPTLVQWYAAAPQDLVAFRLNQSNFNGRGTVPVGTFQGVGPYGTYDLNGNVREWALNPVDGDNRFILGGAWRTQTYQAYDPEALPPMDRSGLNGFRCVRNHAALPAGATAPVVRNGRNFATQKPVSNEVFESIRTMYRYDPDPLNAKSEGIIETNANWTKEKITINAAYGNERLPLYVFLPKNIRPPYQAVLFFPSARVNTMPSSENLGDLDFFDYVIKSGRAIVYPVYKGTYERLDTFIAPGDIHALDQVIEQSKDVGRAVDYMEARPDFDKTRLAYLGVSQGAANGVIFTTLEKRFKAVIFLDGGFFLSPSLPATDQVNFAPRLTKPLLMVNGRYDFTFSIDRAQEPFFNMITTPAIDKHRVVFDTPHDVTQNKPELSKNVLGFLDHYLGQVN
jgi:serine/threonine protein kinase